MPVAPLAVELFESLRDKNKRIVFAESCTGGAVAAELAKIPSVSKILCGSYVTYREESKIRWLGVDSETIENLTAVSAPVAHQMAIGSLRQTPEADLSLAVTGHLGPSAPQESDGIVFIASAQIVKGKPAIRVTENQLTKASREERQHEAVQWVLQAAIDVL